MVYGRVITFPFIQDDYTFIDGYKAGEMVRTHGGHMCPAAVAYIYAMLRIFGENPVPFHIAALLIHFFTTVIIIRFVMAIHDYEPLAWCVGFIYAFAGAVHIECLIWVVGIHDLGGMFFFMLAILLFVRSRIGLGAICYLVACLFKEQAIVLPLILLFWNHRKALPYCFVMVLLLIFHATMPSPLSLPADHPYHMSLWGWHIPANLYHYIRYMSGVFSPLGIGVIVLLLSPIKLGNKTWLATWAIPVLLPVLFLPNHLYRYYLIYLVPACAFVVIGTIDKYLELFSLRRGAIVFVTTVIVITSIWNIQLVLHGVPMDGGTNNLVQKIERSR